MTPKIVALAFLWLVSPLYAGTYFVDFTNGSDSNSGGAQSTAWKHCPGMVGFTGAYSHQAGDRFIFKGGVTWPRSCFQLLVSRGGSSDTVRDYYGTDPMWYIGSFWTRPVFDFENTLIPGWGQIAAGVHVSSAQYVIFDGIEMKRHRGQNAPSTLGAQSPGFCSSTIVLTGTVAFVTIQNCLIRDWDIPLVNGAQPVGTIDGGSGGIMMSAWNGGGAGIKILNNEIHQQTSATKNGYALYLYGEIAGNHIHHTSDVFLGGGSIHHNRIDDVTDATDPSMHEDVIYCTSPSNVYSNVIHTCTAAAPVLLFEPSRSRSGTNLETTLCYNNVIFDTGYPPVSVDNAYANGAYQAIKVYNNTLVTSSSSCVRVVNRGYTLAMLELKNNHYISNTAVKDIPNGTVGTIAESNNVTQTFSAATLSGATSASLFQASSGGTIDAGISFSSIFTTDILGAVRDQNWDVGAYEYGSAQTQPPSMTNGTTVLGTVDTLFSFQLPFSGNPLSYGATGLPTGLSINQSTGVISGTVSSAGSGMITVSGSNSVGTGTATLTLTFGPATQQGLIFTAASGNIAGFSIDPSGAVSQSIETTNPQAGGVATYSFNLLQAGSYVVEVTVNAPTESENSFFVSMDSEPIAPTMIWDIKVTVGFEQRTVSWRGAGTFAAAQYEPQIFSLSAGLHQLIIRGREAHTSLKNISIVRYAARPSSPKNFRLIGLTPQ